MKNKILGKQIKRSGTPARKKKSWDTPARNWPDLEFNIFLIKSENLLKDNETKRNFHNYNST